MEPVGALQWTHLSSATGIIPPPGPSRRQSASVVADLDRDGKNDFVIASHDQGPSVVWYRRGIQGWTAYMIDTSFLSIEAGGTSFDLDGDGDLDLVFGALTDNKVWWWENPYPHYSPQTPWPRREIKNSGATHHHDQIIGDFDGDGRPELVFWNQRAGKLFLAKVPEDVRGVQPWSYREIFSWSSGEYEGLARFDVDGDGHDDIIGGGLWLKHVGGGRFVSQVIDHAQTFSRAAAGQLKEGGMAEVVFVPGDGVGRLKWYEATDDGWIGHDLFDEEVIHGHSLHLADFNGDSHLDILCAEMRQWSSGDDHPGSRMWIFLGDGAGHFTQTVVASGSDNHETKAADLDGDGDVDILGKPYSWETPRLDIWLNGAIKTLPATLSLEKWRRHVIDADKPWRSVFIDAADLDGDSRKDIVTGGWWYRNPGKDGGEWRRQTFGQSLNNMAAVFDADADGDIDILGTEGKGSEPNAEFVWARNNGHGAFTILKNIDKGEGDFLQGVAVATYSNLGPREVALSWHQPGHGVQMLTVPRKADTERWTWRRLSSHSQDEQVTAADIDRDGYADLFLGTTWLCNACPQYSGRLRAIDAFFGTNWLRWRSHRITGDMRNPDRNRLADVNGDGRLDAVVGFEAISVAGKLAWYEQPSSPTERWAEHVIAELIGPMSLDVADMDADGDMDVVVGEHNLKEPETAGLYVFENTDGKGLSWRKHRVHAGDEHHDGAIVSDVDGDGDNDILSIGWGHGRVLLYENLTIAQ